MGSPRGLRVPLHIPQPQEYLWGGAGGRSTLSRYVASQAMAAPSPAGPAGPGVPVVPAAAPSAPSVPGGPPGASCLMRSGVASIICRASVTTSAWGWGTLGLSCTKGVPSPGWPPPLPAGCRRVGPGHPQGGWGALPPPSCHPRRDQGGQGAEGQSPDHPRAPTGTTGCWLCSALGTRGTRRGD